MEKLLSELLNYDIININDGNKYGSLNSNDIAIDNNGNFTLLIINGCYRSFNASSHENTNTLPWNAVKRIGTRTVIIDV